MNCMGLCYFCGKEGETYNCPHCNIKFCDDHILPEKHNCIAYKETSSFEVPEPIKSEPVQESPTLRLEPSPDEASSKQASQKQVSEQKKLMIAGTLVVVSILSILMVFMFATGPETLEGKGPVVVDVELHAMALGQVNVYRFRNDLEELSYDRDILAQTFADELARKGVLEHNPNLEPNVGENVARRTEREMDPKVVIALMVQDMINNDDDYGGVNRANILNPKYTELSIGVAVDGNTVYLVLNFH